MELLLEQISNSFQLLWDQLVVFLPNLLAAVLLLIVAWIIASVLAQGIKKLLVSIQIDQLANRAGMDKLSEQVGRPLSLAGLVAWLVKWLVIITAFVAATDILNMQQVSSFLYESVIPYFGNVIIAVVILLIGAIAANFLAEVVRGAVKASGFKVANALALITKWSIIIFALLAALSQLNVAPAFMQTVFIGVVAMLALAGGLAFGLGGRDHARKILDEVERNATHHD